MKNYIVKHRRRIGIIGGCMACIVALIYLAIVPEEAKNASGLQKIILLYGHSVCWIVLSVASFLWAMTNKHILSSGLAYIALAIYAVFVGTVLLASRM